ncbi:spore cortex-lytic enzyme [Cohnella pontilimi]|uniref:Spore cortex-lytic enzyme n=1 Tax=Cohnella pontilimi TaxID=2564100 RepID=A0A4U0F9R1_9BACL|nr:cell wall hydrolase [Cohnella pontilimi]TJY40834.1 spore cortex-lytic enzyme [Cohnella pontilimi]
MYRILTLFTLLMLIAAATAAHEAAAKNPPVLKQGSKGAEVGNLQFRLHTLGYLKVNPTAHYGALTRKAVQQFQKANRLPSTGVTDLKTWKKLKRKSLSKKEVILLARVIHAEARGETYKGQVAVGAVVLNRLQSPSFPKTLQGVIMQRNAFTAVQDGQIKLKPSATAYQAAKAAVKGDDPTGNALYYCNPAISKSKWFKNRLATKKIAIKKIGNHVFTV